MIILITLAIAAAGAIAYWQFYNRVDDQTAGGSPDTSKNQNLTLPKLSSGVVADKLDHPWDIDFLPDKTLIFSERNGQLKALKDSKAVTLAIPADVYVSGEGGMMGLAVDSNFEVNRYVYACFNSTLNGLDVRVVRWKINQAVTALEDRTDIVTGLPSNQSGRHSGCQLQMDSGGTLWVATGDAAIGTNPQDSKSLGGKILRVGRNGKGVSGNLGEPFDNRIYSYGHRNSQGLALLEKPRGEVLGYSAEHGPNRDDEINQLRPGNFGWNPVPGYNESGSMTDIKLYPQAVRPIWSSGKNTIAVSGLVVLSGEKWGGWNGSLAVGVLKGHQVRILRLNQKGALLNESAHLTNFGRIRGVAQGLDGNLYFTTDNGNDQDKIVKVIPKLR